MIKHWYIETNYQVIGRCCIIYLFIEIYLYRVACSVYKTVFQQGPDKYTNKQNNKE